MYYWFFFPLNKYQYPAINHNEDANCPDRPIDKPQLDGDWKEDDLGHSHGRNTLVPGKILLGICSTYLMLLANNFQKCGTRNIEPTTNHLTNPRRGDSNAAFSGSGYEDKIVLSFEPDDPENPYNWSRVRRA